MVEGESYLEMKRTNDLDKIPLEPSQLGTSNARWLYYFAILIDISQYLGNGTNPIYLL